MSEGRGRRGERKKKSFLRGEKRNRVASDATFLEINISPSQRIRFVGQDDRTEGAEEKRKRISGEREGGGGVDQRKRIRTVVVNLI